MKTIAFLLFVSASCFAQSERDVVTAIEKDSVTINIYPNPFKDKIHINGEFISASIFDSTGKLLVQAKEKEIPVDGYGSLILVIQTKDKKLFFRIVKN